MPEDINRPSSGCPEATGATVRWTDDDLAAAVQTAWQLGYATALGLAAQRVDDLDWLWRPIPRPTVEQRVAARHAEMLRAVEHRAYRAGGVRREHQGGAVDWETGAPVRRLEAVA